MRQIKNINGLLGILLSITLVFFSQTSCKKYLDKKRSQDQAVPSSLNDLQALLDNPNNYAYSPGYLEFVADNYYLTTASWNGAQFLDDRMSYIWDKDARVFANVWVYPYQTIYYTNMVLDYLPKVEVSPADKISYNNIHGTALFYRAFMFHQLAQLFCAPYSSTAGTDPGIVLRMTSIVGNRSTRATVQQTYDQVIDDLKTAAELLPVKSMAVTRPNKAAAYGLLARVYLSMRDYENANTYAEAALAINGKLLDYNTLTPSGQPVLPAVANNPEILFLSFEGHAPTSLLGSTHCKIDSTLYQSYQANDLRKTVFFRSNGSTYYWWGSYCSNDPSIVFDGIAVDEIYLIRAECRARAGNKDGAMNDLNTLLRNRWVTLTFTDLTAVTADDALRQILVERRKELLFRGLRWSDLRRFNLEGANITLKRIINGITYTLPPNDARWILLIPDVEINQSGIAQNAR
jgi:starch-binding outer membrane protein, SusD/RagB family